MAPLRDGAGKIVHGWGSEAIYAGQDLVTGRRVVVKQGLIKLRDGARWDEAPREIRNLQILTRANVRHAPHLVAHFEEGPRWFIAMDHAGRRFASAHISPTEARELTFQQIDALDEERLAGLHYRDLHPGNLTRDPAGTLMLIDQATALEIPSSGLLNPHAIWGAATRAPEDLVKDATLDERTLVYTAATLGYVFRVHEEPFPVQIQGNFKPAQIEARIRAQLQSMQRPPDLSKISEALRPVFRRALSFVPSERYPTLTELSAALRQAE